MKKYIAMFVLVTILAYTSACSTPSHPITPEVEADIKQALYDERYAHRAETVDFSAQNIDITVYGSFEGVSVFYWNGITTESGFEAYDYDTVITVETICNYEFRYSTFRKLQVCSNGTLYSLPEAVERKLLTKNQIRCAFESYKQENWELYAIELDENTLSEEELQHINKILIEHQMDPFGEISTYLGKFQNRIVFRCICNLDGIPFSIGDETFINSYTYWVCSDNSILSLSDAYDEGWITAEELKLIAHRNQSGWDKHNNKGDSK